MEFTSYRDRSVALAADLVNSVGDRDVGRERVEALLSQHGVRHSRPITSADLDAIHAVRDRVRLVFTEPPRRAVEALNALLEATRAQPRLSSHGREPWHLHFASDDQPLAERLGAYAAMGLAIVVADEGFDRLKTCQHERCDDVFVDLSKNRSRRFCSADVCGNRASVAAYRERKRRQRVPTRRRSS